MRDTLAEPFHARGVRGTRLIATLDLFLHLNTWQLLARSTTTAEAVEIAVRAIRAYQKRQSTPANRFHE